MITIKEIAQICGCSVATVNRALYDKPEVSIKTKERIKKIAKDNGYRPHFMARSLASGRTNIIGLIVLDIQNPFFINMITHMNKFFQDKPYSLHLGIMDGTPESEYRVLEQFASMKVDGIIHFPINIGSDYKKYLKQLQIPIVHLCNWLDDEFPFVGVSEKEAIINAVDYIRESGYKELVYVSPPLRHKYSRNMHTLEERLKGAEEATTGMDLHIIKDEKYIESSLDLVKSRTNKVCILCSNDIFALDIMTGFRKIGLQSPDDYGIMGFDNISMLRHISPRLTTIAYPMEELANKVLGNLLQLIDGNFSEKCILKACLISGETV